MREQVGELRGLSEPPAGYEPPRVERVLSPGDFEREVTYAQDQVPTTPA